MVPGVTQIYDNGSIQIFDVTSFLGGSSAQHADRTHLGTQAESTDFGVLVAAIGTCLFLVWVRLRRRRFGGRLTAETTLRWMVGAFVAACLIGCVAVPLPIPPSVVGLAILCALIVFGLVGARTPSAGSAKSKTTLAPPNHPARPSNGAAMAADKGRRLRRAFALAGISLCGAGIVLACLSARGEWELPNQLTMRPGASGQLTVTVQLASATDSAHLVILSHGRIVDTIDVTNTAAVQTIVVPRSAASQTIAILASPHSFLVVS